MQIAEGKSMGRIVTIKVRFTREEYDLLEQMAEQDPETKRRSGSKNRSAYIRKCIFQASYPARLDLKKELKDLKFQIRKIGVNINQVAAKGNSSYVTESDLKVLREALHMVEIQFLEMIRKIEETYGDYKDSEDWNS